MNKEQQLLIDEAYENYRIAFVEGYIHEELDKCLSQEEFLEEIKTDKDFSEKWGLTIEERELSLEERSTIWNNTHNPAGNIFTHNQYDENDIPKRAISLRYNHKTITSYE
jgi:hypothetical protein